MNGDDDKTNNNDDEYDSDVGYDLVSDDNNDDDEEEEQVNSVSSLNIRNDYFHSLHLKSDHQNRPILVVHASIDTATEHGLVFLETFSSLYSKAYDFLIAIADPISRPKYVHEYAITPYSLYAATSLGLHTNDILSTLERLSKVSLTDEFQQWIRHNTERCGKVKMVLKQHRYFIESVYPDVLKELLSDKSIHDARMSAMESKRRSDGKLIIDESTGYLINQLAIDEDDLNIAGIDRTKKQINNNDDEDDDVMDVDVMIGKNLRGKHAPVYSFEFDEHQLEEVKSACSQRLKYPTLEEYDFRRDIENPDLPVSLRPITQIRSYQEKSLSKIFGNGRARSGIIVLPCGAGKTLVGITAMTTIKKSTLIFCTTAVAVDQWERQIKLWSNLPPKYIRKFTKDYKDTSSVGDEAVVLITTYSMISYQVSHSERHQSSASKRIFEFLTDHQWGLILLDEVQVAPARLFRKCVSVTHSYCKIGLTATLVREDQRIEDLYYLIGPKLYEANWLSLQDAGYIATVECVEVWCPMTAEFYEEYMSASQAKKRLLYTMNPNKYRACQWLIQGHIRQGDKVMVFSDNVYALEHYAKSMKCYYLYGGTSHNERTELLHKFQHSPDVNVLFISKVGDNALDLPDVNVIIQISSHFAARRQEAQRLGRILRPKPRTSSRFNAYFYTLVSQDTKEMYYAQKRQRFLVDQGYAFRVVPNVVELVAEAENNGLINMHYSTKESQRELLASVLARDDVDGETERLHAYSRSGKNTNAITASSSLKVKRRVGNISSLTGDDGLVYAEVAKKKKKKKKNTSSHPLLKQRQNEIKERKKQQQ